MIEELFPCLHMMDALIQFRAEETARIKAVSICEKLGIDLPTYLRMCMSRLIQENSVPFSMKVNDIFESRGMKYFTVIDTNVLVSASIIILKHSMNFPVLR